MTAVVESGAVLAARKADANALLVKANGQAAIVAAAAGSMLAICGSVLAASGGPRTPLVWAAGLLGLSMLAALVSLWPRLDGRHGVVLWARMSPEELLADAVPDVPDPAGEAHAVVHLSRLALAKFWAVRVSIGLLAVALLPLAAGWLF